MIGSFTVVCVELTVVVVPSTCKLPLMTTSPSLLNPSGYGSMNILLPAPASDEMTLLDTRIFPSLAFPPSTIKSPPILTFFSTPIPPSVIIEPVSFVVD